MVIVRNVGTAVAPRSTTTVEFLPGGSFDLSTPALAPKAIFGLPPVDFPVSCFNQDCDLKITIDSRNVVREFDEGNNAAVGVCRPEVRSDKVVKDAQQHAEAEMLARDTAGVKKVNNLITAGDLHEPSRASTVIGQRVKDPAGEDVGTVKDLILDREARATHAILAVGGFLGEKRVAVPLSSLTFKQYNTVVVDKRKQDLEKAPSYEEP